MPNDGRGWPAKGGDRPEQEISGQVKTVGTSLHSLGTDPAPRGKLLRLLFLFLLINFAWFYHAGGDNENAHFDQIRALAEEGRWSIDRLAGNTADVIMVHGHIFPNKAPGMTFLCVVPWKICRALVAIGPLSEAVRVHLISYFVQLSTLGLFSALTGCALYVFLCRIGLSSVVSLLLALLYSLGTIAFPFSTIFFSHQLAASFLFLGFFLLWRERQHDTPLNPGEWRCQAEIVLAGVLLGFAPVLEYPAALGTVIIGLYGLTSLDWRRFVLFALAGTAAASSLFLYNWSAFHQLFFISYAAYNAPDSAFRGHRLGFAGLTWPRLSVLWQITFGRQRGLFYINPWLCLILPALVTLRRTAWRRELIVCFAMVVAFFAFNSGFGDSIVYWGGAVSIGPRHIVPMLPFMAVPIALLCRNRFFAVAAIVLGGVSVLAMFCATAITPCLPYEAHDPFFFYLRQLFLGHVSLNAGGICANQIAPGYSFNLSQLLHLPPRAQLPPLALIWAGMLALLFRLTSPPATSRVVRWAPVLFSRFLLVFSLAPLLWDPYAIERPGSAHGLTGGMAPGRFLQNVSSPGANATFLNPEKTLPRHDDVIDFAWNDANDPFRAPFCGMWRGEIYIPVSGIYSFVLESDDGSALYLNSALLIDHWRIGSPPRQTAAVTLSKGFLPITVQYENVIFSGTLRLFWAPPGKPGEIIPPEFLFSR